MNLNFIELGESLGTRKLGKEVRELIISKLDCEDRIFFNFLGVEIVSNSFADECFGKLIEDLGLDFIRKRTTFTNTNDKVSLVIKKCINDRQMIAKKAC